MCYTSSLRTVVRLQPSRLAMACWVRPERLQRRARCWRDSLAQASMMNGSSSRTSAHAAMQMMVMIEMLWWSTREQRPRLVTHTA